MRLGGFVLGLAAAITSALLIGEIVAGQTAAAGTSRDGELVADGAWCWFQDPRAVHYHGTYDRTYVGYVTSVGDVDVVSQDAGTARLTQTTLHPRLQADDHAAPGLVVLPGGRIAVFYSAHTGSAMYYRISSNPEDITAFGPEMTVATNVPGTLGYTYANPIYLSAEHRLYLFFRGADLHPVMTSSTDFAHWTPAVEVITPDEPGRPYVKYATNGVDTIAITFTNGHPREVSKNSVYELTYRAGVLRTPDGMPVSLLDPADYPGGDLTPAHTGAVHPSWLTAGSGGLVYTDPGGSPAWIESLALGASGAPVIVYSTYQDVSDAQYRYARWNGSDWTDSSIVDAGGTITGDPTAGEPQYSGGADIDGADPGTVYLSRESVPGSGQWEIERWHTDDGGLSFDQHSPVTQNSAFKNVRPVVPWGPSGEVAVLWMSGTYDDWSAKYDMQLRELTVGAVPTTARISASSLSVKAGTTVVIGGRIVQGYEGEPVRGATIDLVGHAAGQSDTVLATTRADTNGLAYFSVHPNTITRYYVRMHSTSGWGESASPSVLVRVQRPSVVRISRSTTKIRQGQSVIIGMRATDALTGSPQPHAVLELWQHTTGKPWQRVGRWVSDSTGLVRVTRTPAVTVYYQARLPATTTYQAANSGVLAVPVY